MPAVSRSRERPQKILVAMYRLASGTTQLLRYEDIVVQAFKLFPDEFALRGHPEYPDSSDLHKPLYGPLKREGLIRSGNKKFGLTAKGLEQARKLVGIAGMELHNSRDPRRLSRDVEAEVARMLGSAALKLYVAEQGTQILDTDFFSFLGCTVRTPRNDFLGRVKTTESAVQLAYELKKPDAASAELLHEVWLSLHERFRGLIVREEERSTWGDK